MARITTAKQKLVASRRARAPSTPVETEENETRTPEGRARNAIRQQEEVARSWERQARERNDRAREARDRGDLREARKWEKKAARSSEKAANARAKGRHEASRQLRAAEEKRLRAAGASTKEVSKRLFKKRDQEARKDPTPPPVSRRDIRIEQRERFLASGKSKQATPQQVEAATRSQLQKGNIQVETVTESTGKEFRGSVTQGVFIGTRPVSIAEQQARRVPLGTQTTTITGFDVGDPGTRESLRSLAESGEFSTAGEVFAEGERLAALPVSTRPGEPAPTSVKDTFLIAQEQILASENSFLQVALAPVRGTRVVGGILERTGEKISEFGERFPRTGTRVTGEFLAGVGEEFERKPLISTATTVGSFGVGGVVGGLAGRAVFRIGTRFGPRAQKITSGGLAASGVGLVGLEVATSTPRELGRKAPEIAAFGVGFSRQFTRQTTVALEGVKSINAQQLSTRQTLRELGSTGEIRGTATLRRGGRVVEVPLRGQQIVSGQRLITESGPKTMDLTVERSFVTEAFGRRLRFEQTLTGVAQSKTGTIALRDGGLIFGSRAGRGGIVARKGSLEFVESPTEFFTATKGRGQIFRVVSRGRTRGVGETPFLEAQPPRRSVRGKRTPSIILEFDRPPQLVSEATVGLTAREAGGAPTRLFQSTFRLLESRGKFTRTFTEEVAPARTFEGLVSSRRGVIPESRLIPARARSRPARPTFDRGPVDISSTLAFPVRARGPLVRDATVFSLGTESRLRQPSRSASRLDLSRASRSITDTRTDTRLDQRELLRSDTRAATRLDTGLRSSTRLDSRLDLRTTTRTTPGITPNIGLGIGLTPVGGGGGFGLGLQGFRGRGLQQLTATSATGFTRGLRDIEGFGGGAFTVTATPRGGFTGFETRRRPRRRRRKR